VCGQFLSPATPPNAERSSDTP